MSIETVSFPLNQQIPQLPQNIENVDKISSPTSPDVERKSGRRKINIEYIEDKSRRHITFSKRKAGIMKKAYELSTLTGTQVLLLVASETGHVYTFATPKLQPLITKPKGKNLIQACLNATDPSTVSLMQSRATYSPPQPDSPNYSGNQDLYPEEKANVKTENKPLIGGSIPHIPLQYLQGYSSLPLQDSASSSRQSPTQAFQGLPLSEGRYPFSIPPSLASLRSPQMPPYLSYSSGYQQQQQQQQYPPSPSSQWPPLKMPLQSPLERPYPSFPNLSTPKPLI